MADPLAAKVDVRSQLLHFHGSLYSANLSELLPSHAHVDGIAR